MIWLGPCRTEPKTQLYDQTSIWRGLGLLYIFFSCVNLNFGFFLFILMFFRLYCVRLERRSTKKGTIRIYSVQSLRVQGTTSQLTQKVFEAQKNIQLVHIRLCQTDVTEPEERNTIKRKNEYIWFWVRRMLYFIFYFALLISPVSWCIPAFAVHPQFHSWASRKVISGAG